MALKKNHSLIKQFASNVWSEVQKKKVTKEFRLNRIDLIFCPNDRVYHDDHGDDHDDDHGGDDHDGPSDDHDPNDDDVDDVHLHDIQFLRANHHHVLCDNDENLIIKIMNNFV